MAETGSDILKVVIYGPPECGKVSILKAAANAHGRVPVRMGEASGCRIYRAKVNYQLEDEKVDVQFLALSGWPDFDATHSLLLRGMDAVVFVAPANLNRWTESREAMDLLSRHSALQGIDLATFPLVIQYDYREENRGFIPEQLDAALGIPPGVVTRLVSREGSEDELSGVDHVLKKWFDTRHEALPDDH